MQAKIAKLGNSTGVLIPKPLLEVVGLSDNDAVEIVAENEKLIIRPARKRMTLEKLFDDYKGDPPDGYVWDGLEEPKGRELL